MNSILQKEENDIKFKAAVNLCSSEKAAKMTLANLAIPS